MLNLRMMTTTTTRIELPLRAIGMLLVTLLCALALPSPILAAETSSAETAYSEIHYTGLRKIARNHGLRYEWQKPGLEALLRAEGVTMVFRQHERAYYLNGVQVHLADLPQLQWRQLALSKRDYHNRLQPLLAPRNAGLFRPTLRTIVLDPGHGGTETGAVNVALGLVEKELNLRLAMRLKTLLTERGFAVYLTREDDRVLSLAERPAFANRRDADLFLSLHYNAAQNGGARGLETYVLSHPGETSTNTPNATQKLYAFPGNRLDPLNALIGFYVQRSLMETFPEHNDRGLRRARFAVLRDALMPAALIEGGYLSNPIDAQWLQDPQYHERLAWAILEAILVYEATLNRLAAAP